MPQWTHPDDCPLVGVVSTDAPPLTVRGSVIALDRDGVRLRLPVRASQLRPGRCFQLALEQGDSGRELDCEVTSVTGLNGQVVVQARWVDLMWYQKRFLWSLLGRAEGDLLPLAA